MKVEKRKLTLGVYSDATIKKLYNLNVQMLKTHEYSHNLTLLYDIRGYLYELLSTASIQLRRLQNEEFASLICTMQQINAYIQGRIQKCNHLIWSMKDREQSVLAEEESTRRGFRNLEKIEEGITSASQLVYDGWNDFGRLPELNLMQFQMRYQLYDIYDYLLAQAAQLDIARQSRDLALKIKAYSIKQRFIGGIQLSGIEAVVSEVYSRYPYYQEVASAIGGLDILSRFKVYNYIYSFPIAHREIRSAFKQLISEHLPAETTTQLPLAAYESQRLRFWKYVLEESLPEHVSLAVIDSLSSTQFSGQTRKAAIDQEWFHQQFSFIQKSLLYHGRITNELFSDMTVQNWVQIDESQYEQLKRQISLIQQKISDVESYLGDISVSMKQTDVSYLPADALTNPGLILLIKQQMHPNYSYKQLLYEELSIEADVIKTALQRHLQSHTYIAQIGDLKSFFDHVDAIFSALFAYFSNYDPAQYQTAKKRQIRTYSRLKYQENYRKIQYKNAQPFSLPTTVEDLESAWKQRYATGYQRSYATAKKPTYKQANSQKNLQVFQTESNEPDFYQ